LGKQTEKSTLLNKLSLFSSIRVDEDVAQRTQSIPEMSSSDKNSIKLSTTKKNPPQE